MPLSHLVRNTTGSQVLVTTGVLTGVGPQGPPGEIIDTYSYSTGDSQECPNTWAKVSLPTLVANENNCLNVAGPIDFYIFNDGVYSITARAAFDSGAGGTRRYLGITKDDELIATAGTPTLTSALETTTSCTALTDLTSANRLNVVILDDDNEGLSVQAVSLQITRVGTGPKGDVGETGDQGPEGPGSTVPGPASFAQITETEPAVRDTGDLWVDPSNELFSWDDAWTPLALVNGWVQYSGFAPVGYRMLPFGVVELRGAVTNPSSDPADLVATLPAEYSPSYTTQHMIACSRGGKTSAQVAVKNTGTIEIQDTHGASGVYAWAALDGVRITLGA